MQTLLSEREKIQQDRGLKPQSQGIWRPSRLRQMDVPAQARNESDVSGSRGREREREKRYNDGENYRNSVQETVDVEQPDVCVNLLPSI